MQHCWTASSRPACQLAWSELALVHPTTRGVICCSVSHCLWCFQVAGALAQKQAKAGAQLQGVLVRQGGKHTVVAAQDLPNFTSLHPGRILQRQILSLHKSFSEVILCWTLR